MYNRLIFDEDGRAGPLSIVQFLMHKRFIFREVGRAGPLSIVQFLMHYRFIFGEDGRTGPPGIVHFLMHNRLILCCIFVLSGFNKIDAQIKPDHPATPKVDNVSETRSLFDQYFTGFEYALSGKSIRFIGKTSSTGFQLHRFYGGKKIFTDPDNSYAIYYTVSADLFTQLNYTVDDTGKQKQRFGLGISPAGYTFSIPMLNTISASAGFSGGFSLFDKRFPDKKGIPVNFTYSLNSALLIKTHQEFWITLRARFYHHSNAEIAQINPGLDLIMLSAGFQGQF